MPLSIPYNVSKLSVTLALDNEYECVNYHFSKDNTNMKGLI